MFYSMGVAIHELLPKEEIKFEDLANKRIGIDAFNALYQFLSSIRGIDGTPLQDSKGRVTSHLQGLFTRSVNLMGKGIKIAYIFDGHAPALKLQEQQARNERKLVAMEKYKEAEEEEDIEAMGKYAKQFVRLNADMIEESKELVRALGLPCIEAPSEAEAQGAFMCKNNEIYAVASQDSDALLFGSPRLIRNLTLSQKRRLPSGSHVITFLEFIELKKVLDSLGIDHEQLVMMGILVGTDFNRGGVKGIGPKKALKLVQKYKGGYDEMFESLNPWFNWKDVYNVFRNIETTSDYKLAWKPVDRVKVHEILVERHEFNAERVQSILDKLQKEDEKDEQGDLGRFF
jgi:flap endonuclease-1